MSYYNDYILMMNALNMASAGSLYGDYTGSVKTGGYTGVSFAQILNNQTASAARRSFEGLSSSMDAIFEEAAAKYGVDANLLKAIGKAESNFDASAVSSAGAMGVMQLMPGTAQSLGVSNAYDARENIMGGASYIAGLLNQYNGDRELALAAYNAGSGNVQKYGGIPPFPETQNYVKKVLDYAGQEIEISKDAAASESAAAKQSSVQTGTKDYWSYLVDLMRIQMDMKLVGVLSADNEEEDALRVI